MDVPGLEEELRRAQRPGREHDPVREDPTGDANAHTEVEELHAVPVGTVGGRIVLPLRVDRADALHQVLGADIGSVAILGHEEIVEVQRVLRVRVAADEALAAVGTTVLRRPASRVGVLTVDALFVPVLAPVDGQVQQAEGPGAAESGEDDPELGFAQDALELGGDPLARQRGIRDET